MDESHWYLRKAHDGSQFGPIPFSQLKQWAADAQVSPLDRVSTDEQTWIKAPMVPELEMDYLIEVSLDHYYGPTTVGAIREFLEAGEITLETRITNSKDASQLHVRDLLPPPPADNGASSALLGRSSIRINLQQRIRELEEALLEERRARETAEMLVEKLEAQIARMTGH